MNGRTARRLVAIAALLASLAGALVIAAYATEDRPPITAQNLAASLTDEIGSVFVDDEAECTRAGKGWICGMPDPGGSTEAVYSVSATSTSCWAARLRHGERAPQTASGCVGDSGPLRIY